jgi:hypothetical protein
MLNSIFIKKKVDTPTERNNSIIKLNQSIEGKHSIKAKYVCLLHFLSAPYLLPSSVKEFNWKPFSLRLIAEQG